MEARSDSLYAEPSFWEGMARILDFGNTLNEYNRSPSEKAADDVALWLDWGVVGSTIRKAVEAFKNQAPERVP